MPNEDGQLGDWLREATATPPDPWILAPEPVNPNILGPCGRCSGNAMLWDMYSGQGTDPDRIRCGDCQPHHCYICEESFERDDIYVVGQQWYCDSCRDSECWYCDGHEEYHTNRVDYTNVDGNVYCNDELRERHWWCDNCDDWVDSDSDCGNCEEGPPSRRVAYQQVDCDCRVPNTKPIHSYNCKPPLKFFGEPSNKLYIGLELETEVRRNLSEGAVFMDSALGDFGQLKSDSSIGYDENRNQRHQGFEIVTMPVSLDMWQEEVDFFNGLDYLRENHLARAWDGSNCGIHLHLSRDAFDGGTHLHRFLKLGYGNAETFSKFAGRVNPNYASWSDCTKMDDYGGARRTLAGKMHRERGGYGGRDSHAGAHSERHSAINLTNRTTIELRFFRGNLRKEGILRDIEFAHAMVEYTRGMPFHDVQLGMLDWEWFEAYITDNNGLYPNAYARIQNVRGLSVNDKTLIEA